MSKNLKKILVAVVALVSMISVCLLTACGPKTWAEAENKTATEVYTFSGKLELGSFDINLKNSTLNVVRQYDKDGNMLVTINGTIKLNIPMLNQLSPIIASFMPAGGPTISENMDIGLDATIGYNKTEDKYKGFGKVSIGSWKYEIAPQSAPIAIDASKLSIVKFDRDAVNILYSNDVVTTGTVKSDVAFKGWYDQFVAGVVNNTTKYPYTANGEDKQLTIDEMSKDVTKTLLGADKEMGISALFDYIVKWKGHDIACTAEKKGDLIQKLTTEQKDVTFIEISKEDCQALCQEETVNFVLSFFDNLGQDTVNAIKSNAGTVIGAISGFFDAKGIKLTTSLKIDSTYTYGKAKFTAI